MPMYDTRSFDPPAPIAYVTIRHPQTKASYSNVPMLLDTGADATLIPRQVINYLNVPIVANNEYELMGFDGTISVTPVVKLELVFCERTFRGQFLLIDETWGILGRNVLNVIPIIFNGPRLLWVEYKSINEVRE